MVQIGYTGAWLWVAIIEPIRHRILGVYISRHRNMLVAESFLKSLIKLYGKHVVSILKADHGILKLAIL
jgi:transposase-like protein